MEENHRGCGIGRRLMDKALSQLHEYNLKNITLSVVIGNENVLPFYEKFGFYPRLTELWLKSTDTSKTI
ncbi:hypothetical protein SDC9_169903 [bioreactor metagenome]|uniref:N-acetyltransferase domain-containing protein n=1 Tax=bioreactor metagenome TaxID=1076179 RepID=A0A645G941_9ZZZZ